MSTRSPAMSTLVEAATLAPSGDNTQPWRMKIDEAKATIRVTVDPKRDPSPMNAGQCMSAIAIGAVIENLVQTAEHNDWRCDIDHLDDGMLFRLDETMEAEGDIPDEITDRCSNRQQYDGGSLDAETLSALEATAEPNETTILWIADEERRARLCRLIAEADSIILSAAPVRQAFLDNVRFDLPPQAVADWGLSMGSLELAAPERTMLRAMRKVPATLLRLGGVKHVFHMAASKLARSASAFCVVAAGARTTTTDHAIGRALQRAWLQATTQGLAAQPMMSLFVLQNMLANGDASLIRALGRKRSEATVKRMQELLALPEAVTSGALLRLGFSSVPSARVGRLKPDDNISWTDASDAD